jgi:predicted PurR-regulated permease PerM
MEFFIPSLITLIIAGIVVFVFIPRFAPILLLIISAVLLGVGVYHHYTLFEGEYRYSTWQESLKQYGPAIIIAAVVIFLVTYILSFFGGVSVPIPEVPSIPEMPAMPTMPTMPEMPEIPSVEDVATNIGNKVSNVFNNIKNTATNVFNRRNEDLYPDRDLDRNPNRNRNRNMPNMPVPRNNQPNRKNMIRPSFIEEL